MPCLYFIPTAIQRGMAVITSFLQLGCSSSRVTCSGLCRWMVELGSSWLSNSISEDLHHQAYCLAPAGSSSPGFPLICKHSLGAGCHTDSCSQTPGEMRQNLASSSSADIPSFVSKSLWDLWPSTCNLEFTMLSILYKLFLLYMCMGVFPAYMSGAPEGQKRALNPPGELPWGARNLTKGLCKSRKYS